MWGGCEGGLNVTDVTDYEEGGGLIKGMGMHSSELKYHLKIAPLKIYLNELRPVERFPRRLV